MAMTPLMRLYYLKPQKSLIIGLQLLVLQGKNLQRRLCPAAPIKTKPIIFTMFFENSNTAIVAVANPKPVAAQSELPV